MDALCFDDLDAFGTELDDPVEELQQDLFHRLIEKPGENPDDSDRGVGINAMLSGVVDGSLKHRIEADFVKDDRVTACNATITEVASGQTGSQFRIDIEIQPEGSISILLDPVTGTAARAA